MTTRERQRIEQAMKAYANANFEAGEWDRNESDEPYERVHARVERTEARLRAAIGLPARVNGEG